jgi:hypothetical protein
VRGRGKQIQHLPDPSILWVGEMKAAAILSGNMREMRQRSGHKVHRYQVDVAALNADQRHPLRQCVTQPLHRLEQVVGAVDLVHHARDGMADNHARPIDAPRHLRTGANQRLGVVLAAKVGMIQPRGLLEHVLGERTPIASRGRDAADEVKALRPHGLSE